MSQSKDRANKLIFTFVLVVAIATLTLLGMSEFTPAYNKSRVAELLQKPSCTAADYTAMLNQARILEANLSTEDDTRSEEDHMEMLESYLSLTDRLAEGEDSMDSATLSSYHQWIETIGAGE